MSDEAWAERVRRRWDREDGTTPADRDAADVQDDDGPVGEGPLYAAMREEAKKLIPLFASGGVENCQPWWGAGICGVVREEDGTNRVHVETFGKEKRGLGVNWPASIEHLRASAISLLIYCEAYEEAESNG